MSHSTRKCNPEGLLEKELRERERTDTMPGHKYKKRHRKELEAEEIEDIVHKYQVQHLTQVETAKQHRISPSLVSRLVEESKKQPEKLRETKLKEKNAQKAQESVTRVVSYMLERSIPIEKAATVQRNVK